MKSDIKKEIQGSLYIYIFFFFQLFYFIYELVWALKNKGAYLLVV